MFGFSKPAKPSLEAVRFDTTGYAPQGEPQPGKLRIWHTPQGDGLGLYFFPLPPDLPANAVTTDELAAVYRRGLGDSGGKLVEVRVVVAAGDCPAVRTILSVPQRPHGRTYVGSLTVPFRDFSFVLKCQCPEHGVTGVREAILLEHKFRAKESVSMENGRLDIPNWNPDDAQYDSKFPNHPVARVRRVLDHVTATLTVDDAVRKLPGFALPS